VYLYVKITISDYHHVMTVIEISCSASGQNTASLNLCTGRSEMVTDYTELLINKTAMINKKLVSNKLIYGTENVFNQFT